MKRILIVLFALLANFSLFAGEYLIGNPSLQNKMPVRQVQDNEKEGLVVEWTFPSLQINQSTLDGVSYQFLHIPGFELNGEAGHAALPVHYDLVAAPKNARTNIRIIDIQSREFNVGTLAPMREPARDTEGAPEPPVVFSEQYYSAESFLPAQNIQVVEELKVRGMALNKIAISPVQYLPSKGIIRIITKIKYEITFTGGGDFVEAGMHSQNFLKQYANYMLNNKAFSKAINSKAGYPSTDATSLYGAPKSYIIVTTDEFAAAADSIADWRRKCGQSIEIIKQNNWTAATVKDAIHNRYNAWTPKPDYLLILGDHDDVPATIHYSPAMGGQSASPFGSDIDFVCMDGVGDYVPEMAKGRISVANATQAMNVVQKIINYERNPVTDTSFYQNGVNCAQFQDDNDDGAADRRFTHTSEDVRNYMMTQGYDIERIYYTGSSIYPQTYNTNYYSDGQNLPADLLKSNGFNWNGGSSNITASINAGKFYLLHRDHGFAGGSGWAHPYYVKNHINSLNNGNQTPVVFSINCHTGEFTLSECFSEKFLRHSNGGAVGVVGASYFSLSGWNDGLVGGLFDAIYPNPGLIPDFGYGGINNPVVNTHGEILTMGDVLNQGLIRMVETWGGSNYNKYEYELFHWFGDPAMRIRTAMPQQITLQHTDTASCNSGGIAITNCNIPNATASIVTNGILAGTTQLANGQGSIAVTNATDSIGILYVFGKNGILYHDTVYIQGSNMAISHVSQNNSCKNGTNGEIILQISCGSMPYNISWNTGDTVQNLSNLTAGTYIYTITDQSGTSLSDTIEITEPAQPLAMQMTAQDVLCYFQTNGEASSTVSGGVPPYTYYWSNGLSGATAQNLVAGNYSLTVTDALGCQITDSVTISQPQAISLTIDPIHDLNNDCKGEAHPVINGGTPPFTYSWNDANNQTTLNAVDLCAGLYRLTLTDHNGCIKQRVVVIENTVGLNPEEEAQIQVYPNPVHNQQLIIQFGNAAMQLQSLKVFDARGRLVKVQRQQQAQSIHLSLPQLQSGMYFLQMQFEDGKTHSRKFIVE